MSWAEVDGGGWRWVEVGGVRWSWVKVLLFKILL